MELNHADGLSQGWLEDAALIAAVDSRNLVCPLCLSCTFRACAFFIILISGLSALTVNQLNAETDVKKKKEKKSFLSFVLPSPPHPFALSHQVHQDSCLADWAVNDGLNAFLPNIDHLRASDLNESRPGEKSVKMCRD